MDEISKKLIDAEIDAEERSIKKEKATVSETGSIRLNIGKARMDLVPTSLIESVAEVLTYGATKYSERQWEWGNKFSVPYASLMRHLIAWWGGENRDKESGLPHTYHIAMNAAMLIEYEKNYPYFDDRPKGENNGTN